MSTAPLRGGAEEYALTIAMAARSRGWNVLAAVPEAEGTRSLVGDLRDGSVPVRALPCIDPWLGGTPATARDLGLATRQTVGIVRAARPDVVHVTLAWPSFGMSSLLAPAILNVPTVVVFQLVPQTLYLQWPRVLYKIARARRQRWVTVSEHGRQVIARRLALPARSIEVINNGVPPPFRRPVDPEEQATARAAVRREIGLPPDSRLVVSVGRLHEQKAHADLCLAAAPLLKGRPDLYVLVAGDGPERVELERLTDELGMRGRLRWLGRRHDVPRLLAASDLFAFPSRFEGLPFALAEAMAAGLPVVTAAFPGAEELVRNGEHGLVVPVGDTVALREALAWALEHSQAMDVMARAAQDRARDFSEERMVERTLALLGRSASPGRAPLPE